MKKLKVILELEKCIINATTRFYPINRSIEYFYIEDYLVYKRPYLNEFLEKISGKYECYLYTKATEKYASKIVGKLEEEIKRKVFKKLICRDTPGKWCTEEKDIRNITRDLNRVVLIDNSTENVMADQRGNCIPIRTFDESIYCNTNDRALLELMRILSKIEKKRNVRNHCKSYDYMGSYI